MSFYDAIRVGASGAADFEIERSLRFNDGDTAYLDRTFGSGGNVKKWTFSAWIKRANLVQGRIFGGNANAAHIRYQSSSDVLFWDMTATGQSNVNSQLKCNFKHRDPSAWFHLVCALDTDESTANNRMRMYINGSEITDFESRTNPSSGYSDFAINKAESHTLGYRTSGQGSAGLPFDGYMAEINFIDGQQYDASYFGETNATTGQWIPKKYTGGYGTTGFHLNFSDNSGTTATTLGKDSSGNSNNWTPNNFSVSAGTGNDSLEDTPTNNFCTMNPLNRGVDNPTCANGNLYFGGSTDHSIVATFAIPSSGKWYWEYTKTTGTLLMSGIIGDPEGNNYLGTSNFFGSQTYAYSVYAANGNKYNAGSAGTYMATPSTSTTIMIAFDADTRKLYFGADGNWGNGSGSTNQTFDNAAVAYTVTDGITYYPGGSFNSGSAFANFGQRPFSYKPTGYKSLCSANLPNPTILLPNKHFDNLLYTGNAGSNTISGLNFSPDWVWGKGRNLVAHHFLADTIRGVGRTLRSDSTTAEIDNTSSPKFTSFTSNGFTLNTTDDQFNGNSNTYVAWNWNAGDTDGATYTVKVVSDSGNKYRFNDFGTSAVTLDLAEGGTYIFNMDDSSNATHPFSIGTAANGTVYTSGITYFLDGVSKTYSQYTSGFAAASTRRLHITVPASAPQLYYWCSAHSGMGGAINTNSTLGSSNFDGSIQSTVKANTTSGFSIVTYTGTGADGTVGHGLGVKPDYVVVKNRDSAEHWSVKHKDLTSGYNLKLNLSEAQGQSTGSTNGIIADLSSSSNFSLTRTGNTGNYDNVNINGDKHVAYCFSGVKGYSKFGKYTGNGNLNGPFVFTGFRPAWVLVKGGNFAGNWNLFDNRRPGFNVTNDRLFPNLSDAETDGSPTNNQIDILSNGFKLKGSNVDTNSNGSTFIYLAFAESPFKNSRAR